MGLRLILDDKEYNFELDRLTLGDMRLLERHFGITDVTKLETEPGNPSVISGLVYLGLKSEHPDWEHQRLSNFVDEIPLSAFADAEVVKDEPIPKAKSKAGK